MHSGRSEHEGNDRKCEDAESCCTRVQQPQPEQKALASQQAIPHPAQSVERGFIRGVKFFKRFDIRERGITAEKTGTMKAQNIRQGVKGHGGIRRTAGVSLATGNPGELAQA